MERYTASPKQENKARFLSGLAFPWAANRPSEIDVTNEPIESELGFFPSGSNLSAPTITR